MFNLFIIYLKISSIYNCMKRLFFQISSQSKLKSHKNAQIWKQIELQSLLIPKTTCTTCINDLILLANK